MNTIDQFVGTFEGTGAWYDSVGQSSSYTVRLTNIHTADGFEVAFKHDFDDGTVVDARLTMIWIAPNIFRVDVSGTPVGNGYVFDGYCHYHMNVGDRFVEASYRSSGDGLEVFGSSTTNARRQLHRVEGKCDPNRCERRDIPRRAEPGSAGRYSTARVNIQRFAP